jgi:hypothetical protein
VATITPDAYTDGRQALAGTGNLVADNYGKFVLTPSGSFSIAASGCLDDSLPKVARIGTAEFSTLAGAIAAAPTSGTNITNPTTITIIADITLTAAIPSTGTGIVAGKHIKLIPDTSDRTITRQTFLTSFFTIAANASLTIEGNGGRTLTLDGNRGVVTTATTALVTVTGNFVMNNGAVLRNNRATSGGGAVLVNNGAVFTMNGGTISDNTATGTTSGGGVYVNGATAAFTMNGGTISGNTATNGAGVYVNNGTFTMSGNAKVDADNAVYLAANMFITIDGSLSAATPVATITPNAYADGRRVLANNANLANNHNKLGITNSGKLAIAADRTLVKSSV